MRRHSVPKDESHIEMKRTNMRVVTSYIAVVLVGAFLCLGCKPSGDKPDKPGASNGAETSAKDLGAKALEDEDWARAYDKFTDAIAADDADVDAYYGRASASLEIAQGHYRLAQAAATNQDVEAGKSEAAKADESFQKAIEDCDKAIALDANYADAYYLKGVVAQYQGAWEQGIDAFTQCVKIAPDRADAYHRRGEIYDHIGDYMNSSVDFKKAGELGYSDGSEQAASDVDMNDFSDLNYEPEEATDAQDSAGSAEPNGSESEE